MKLEIYEPHKVGWVTLNPYEYEYNGRYQEVVSLLDPQPNLYKGVAEGDYDGEVELTGREYLERLGLELRKSRVWDWKIVDDG